MIPAFHSFWSRPGRVKNWGQVTFPDHELLTALLSALEWRAHNGPIRMITDSPGAEFFARAGFDGVWDEVRCDLDRAPESIDPYLFWAAGKLYALRTMPCPCAMLDTDLIVWRRLEIPPDTDVMAAHREGLDPWVYPDPRGFRLKPGYAFPAGWDFTSEAANTAFLYLRDPAFRDHYVDAALTFMERGLDGGLDPTQAMCFAEQRVLPLCAAEQGQTLRCLLNPAEADAQTLVTHVWGYKHLMSQSEQARTALCVRCVRRVLRDFPAWVPRIADNPDLAKYLPPAREER